ncbi:hypothetical protein D5086_016209 [Populus alba]|uniref:Uncharacterized protein n=1 Tax=Populus alba TaxID=43335 RepID=A0ACC4BTJ7_POPAL
MTTKHRDGQGNGTRPRLPGRRGRLELVAGGVLVKRVRRWVKTEPIEFGRNKKVSLIDLVELGSEKWVG